MQEEIEETTGDRFTLSDAWAILQMQKWVVISSTVTVLALSAVWTAMAPRYYTSRSTVHITTQRGQEMEMGQQIDEAVNPFTRPVYLKTRIAIMRSSQAKKRALAAYQALEESAVDGEEPEASMDPPTLALLSRAVKYVPRAGTELLDIVVTTKDPKVSARLANLLAQEMRDDSLNSAADRVRDAQEWTEARLTEADANINLASAKLRTYQKQNDMADVGQGSTSLTSRMDQLKQAYGAANTERVQQETRVRLFENLLRRKDYVALSKSMASPTISQLTQEYSSLITDQARLSAKYGELHPKRTLVQDEVLRIEGALREEVERTLRAERAQLRLLVNRERDLSDAIDGGKVELLEVAGRTDDYEKLLLDLESFKEQYKSVRLRKIELELQSKTQLNNVRIVEEAFPAGRPASPNVTSNLSLGFAGGLLLGLGIAGLREWMDDTVSSPLDVSTYLRVRLLGVIPQIQEADQERDRSLYTHLHPKSNISEAIRGIRTVIELSPTGVTPKRLMVTSALSSEGKTSTIMRLAIAYASLNRKVVVVDADMRRPRVHKIFGDERVPGLATCLLGDAGIDEAARPTGIPNLSYVPAGRAFDRPNELLTSAAFEKTLAELDAEYDMVFVDTPPSILLSDARMISRHMDGVVMVVRERSTSRFVVRDAIAGLEQVGANVLGAIVNGVDVERHASYAYYGYGYGYGYGRYEEDEDDQTESAAK